MKRASKQCPNGHGAMHRAHVKITKDGKQAWKAIKWQYCEKCGMILPDNDAN